MGESTCTGIIPRKLCVFPRGGSGFSNDSTVSEEEPRESKSLFSRDAIFGGPGARETEKRGTPTSLSSTRRLIPGNALRPSNVRSWLSTSGLGTSLFGVFRRGEEKEQEDEEEFVATNFEELERKWGGTKEVEALELS